MNKYCKLIIICSILAAPLYLQAQKQSPSLTSGVGIIAIPGTLSKTFSPAIAFNSGIEFSLSPGWYLHGEAGFNSLPYDQQNRDDESPYLFRNTSSTLFLVGINGGRSIKLDKLWSASVYTGAGYVNIGEPRIVIEQNIARQLNTRKGGITGKAGFRLNYQSRSAFLQTIYFDASYWTSSVNIQQKRLGGLSFFFGSKIPIGK